MNRMRLIQATRFVFVGLVISLISNQAEAGNGKYDPETRSFSLNYIYLNLPATQTLDEQAVFNSGASAIPNEAQKADITRFWKLVSDELMQVTGNRASIGQLTEVKDVRSADVVISLTGKIRPFGYGGAWAPLLGLAQGGTVNIYYQDLVDNETEDVTETVVHELCHYFFGLPDEYRAGSAQGLLCPPGAAKGCLMDNFHNQWYGRLCSNDHNAAAPGANGFSTVFDHAISCQDLVDQFFTRQKVGPATSTPIVAAQKPGQKKVLSSANRAKVLTPARTLLATIKADLKDGAVTDKIRDRLKSVIKAGLDQLNQVNFESLVENLVQDAIFTELGAPPVLKPIADLLKSKALEFAKQQSVDSNSKVSSIQSQLVGLIHDEIGNGKKLGAAPTISADDLKYVSYLATQAADQNLTGSISNRELGTRFNHRNTIIFEPPILAFDAERLQVNPKPNATLGLDEVQTQGSEKSDYNDLRRLNSSTFSLLIDRSQITALTASSASQDQSKGVTVDLTPLNSSGVGYVFEYDKKEAEKALVPVDPANLGQGKKVDRNQANLILEERVKRIDTMLGFLKEQIASEKVDNIVLLIPPGGLTDHFDPALETLAKAFIGKSDLRLDIALVGSVQIPTRLRDFVTRTSGSILTVTDSDEVGAVAQRLAGEQTQGTWISIPQQDMLIFDGYDARTAASNETNGTLFKRLEKNRLSHKIRSTGQSRVVLKPFYVDSTTDYELIIGLTQPITVAGLSRFAVGNNMVPLQKENSPAFKDPVMRLVAGEIEGEAIARIEAPEARPFYAWTPNLVLDRSKSTDSTLVFRLPAQADGGAASGWYSPVLLFDETNFKTPEPQADGSNRPSANIKDYSNKKIHFTFSVGTSTSKAQLSANLVQDLTGDPAVVNHGTIDPKENQAVITAVLSAGAGLIQADVRGYFQKIDKPRNIDGDDQDITTYPVIFNDSGIGADKISDDGIYTAVISLEAARTSSAGYRVFIEGRSVKGVTKFVPSGEPLAPAKNEAVSTKPLNLPAPSFQRATSIEFFVPANVVP